MAAFSTARPELQVTCDATVCHSYGFRSVSGVSTLILSTGTVSTSKGKPLRDLGVTQKRLDAAVHHLEGHRPSTVKYYVYAALCLWWLIFLLLLAYLFQVFQNLVLRIYEGYWGTGVLTRTCAAGR